MCNDPLMYTTKISLASQIWQLKCTIVRPAQTDIGLVYKMIYNAINLKILGNHLNYRGVSYFLDFMSKNFNRDTTETNFISEMAFLGIGSITQEYCDT